MWQQVSNIARMLGAISKSQELRHRNKLVRYPNFYDECESGFMLIYWWNINVSYLSFIFGIFSCRAWYSRKTIDSVNRDGVTKAPVVIYLCIYFIFYFYLFFVGVRGTISTLWQYVLTLASHPYDTGATAAQLRRRMSNMNVIFNVCAFLLFW